MHDCSFYWLGTDSSIKSGGVKLVLLPQLVKWCGHVRVFPYVNKISTLTHNRANIVVFKELSNDSCKTRFSAKNSIRMQKQQDYKYQGKVQLQNLRQHNVKQQDYKYQGKVQLQNLWQHNVKQRPITKVKYSYKTSDNITWNKDR